MKLIFIIFLISLITSLYIVKWKEVRISADRILYKQYNISLEQYIYLDHALDERLHIMKQDTKHLLWLLNDAVIDNFLYLKICLTDLIFIHNSSIIYEMEKRSIGDISQYDVKNLKPELLYLYNQFIHPNFEGTYRLSVQLLDTYIKGYSGATYILYAYYNDPIISELLMSSVVGHMLFSWVKEWMFQIFSILSFGALRFWQYNKIADVFLQLEFVGQVNASMNWLIMIRVAWITLGLPDIFMLRGLYLLGIVTLGIMYFSFSKMKSHLTYKIEIKADINVSIDNAPKSYNPSFMLTEFFTYIMNYQSFLIKLSQEYDEFRPVQGLVAPNKRSFYLFIILTPLLVPIIFILDTIIFIILWLVGGIILYAYLDNKKISPEIWNRVRNISKDQFLSIKGHSLDISKSYIFNLVRYIALRLGWTDMDRQPIREKGYFEQFIDDMRTAYPDSVRARLARIYRVPIDAISGSETHFPTDWDRYVVFIRYLSSVGETIAPNDAVLSGFVNRRITNDERPTILKQLESFCIAKYGVKYVDTGVIVSSSDVSAPLFRAKIDKVVKVDKIDMTEDQLMRVRAVMRITVKEYEVIVYDLYHNTTDHTKIELVETSSKTLYAKFLMLRLILLSRGLDVHPEQFIEPEDHEDWQVPYECANFSANVHTFVMEANAYLFGVSYYEEHLLIEDLRKPKSAKRRGITLVDRGLWNAFQLLSDRIGEIYETESDFFGPSFVKNVIEKLNDHRSDNEDIEMDTFEPEDEEYVELEELSKDDKGKEPDTKETRKQRKRESIRVDKKTPLLQSKPLITPLIMKRPETELFKGLQVKNDEDTYGDIELERLDLSDSSDESVDEQGKKTRKHRFQPPKTRETEDDQFVRDLKNRTLASVPRAKRETFCYVDTEIYPLYTASFSEKFGHSEGNWVTIGMLLEDNAIQWPHPNVTKYNFIRNLPSSVQLRYGHISGSNALRPDLMKRFMLRIKRSPLTTDIIEDWLSHFEIIDFPRAIAWLIKMNYEYLQRFFSNLELQYYVNQSGAKDHRQLFVYIEHGPKVFLTSTPGQIIVPDDKEQRTDYMIKYINMESIDYTPQIFKMPKSKLQVVGRQRGYNLPVQVLVENKLMKQKIMTIDQNAQFIYTRVIPTLDLIVESFNKYEKLRININLDDTVQGVTLRSWLISGLDKLIKAPSIQKVTILSIDEFNRDMLSEDSRKAYPGHKCRNLGIRNKADQLELTKSMAKRLRQEVLQGRKPPHLWSWMGVAKASKIGAPQIRGVLAGEMYFYINQYLLFDPFVHMMKTSRVSNDFKLFFGEFDAAVKKFPAVDMKEVLDLKDQGGRTQPIIGEIFYEWYSRLLHRAEDRAMLKYILDTIFVCEFQIPELYGGYVFRKQSGWSDGPYGTSAFDSFSMITYYLTSVFYNAQREQVSLNTIDLAQVNIETHADNWIHSYPVNLGKIFAWDQRVLTWYGQEVKGVIDRSVDITQLELMGFKIRLHNGKYYGYRSYEKTIKSLVLNRKEYKSLSRQEAYELGIIECLMLVDCWNDVSYSLLSRLHAQYRNVTPEIVEMSYWTRMMIIPRKRYAQARQAWEPKPINELEDIDEEEVDHFSLYEYLLAASPPAGTLTK